MGIESLPLVHAGDLVYQYAFTVPKVGTSDAEGFAYGGSALAFDPIRKSLFLVGFELANKVAEISIPAAAGVATILQPLGDVTEGQIEKINPVDPNDKRIGGLLPWGAKLLVSAYAYYDNTNSTSLSHFVTGVSPLSTTGDLWGPFQVGSAPVKAGYVGGYMGIVPPAWHLALGGPAFTGQSCLAIVNRTSQGPAVCTFDPNDVGIKLPCPASPLVYYDSTHPLGAYNSANPLYNGTAKIGGMVMPEGSRSVLFFGRIGSTFAYGPGTTNTALVGTIGAGFSEPYVYDPEDQSKGTHGYPYRYQVWAYDANDLAAVKAGSKQPWEPKPYATWELKFPTPAPFTRIMGAVYDGETGRLFLAQFKGDGNKPLIHVYKIGAGSGPVITPPPPPPPPQPTPAVTVQSATLTPVKWRLEVTDVPPPGFEVGGSVQMYRNNGVVLGTVDATSPYTRSALVDAGTYTVTAVWTDKTGKTVTRAPITKTCP